MELARPYLEDCSWKSNIRTNKRTLGRSTSVISISPVVKFSGIMSDDSREENVYMAKLAEQAERYDEVCVIKWQAACRGVRKVPYDRARHGGRREPVSTAWPGDATAKRRNCARRTLVAPHTARLWICGRVTRDGLGGDGARARATSPLTIVCVCVTRRWWRR